MPRYQEDNGYVSMLDPNIFQFQQQLLNRKQQQYDAGYSIALDTKDKYSMFDSSPEDVPVRNQALDQFTGNVNELVQSKYNGDWGRASKEVAGLVTKFKQDPVWETMRYAKQQRAMEDELTARFGPSALPFASMRGKSVLGAEGKLLKPEEMRVNVEERLNDLPVMDKIWDELAPTNLSGTRFGKKKLPNGQEVDVLIDSTGGVIDQKLINKELDNMLKIFKETTLNYNQRIREYTELSVNPQTGKNYTIEEAEKKIKEDFLAVGMTKRKNTTQENWRVIDPDSYSSGRGKVTGAGYKGIPVGRSTEDLQTTKEARETVMNFRKKGIKNPIFENTPSGILAKEMWDQTNKVLPMQNSLENEVQAALTKNKLDVPTDVLSKILQVEGEPIEGKVGTNQEELLRMQKQFQVMRKEMPGKSESFYNAVYNNIKNIKKSNKKFYDEASEIKTNEFLKENYGPIDLTFTRPEPWTEQGDKQLTALKKVNDPKDGMLKINNFEFTEGSFSGKDWIKDDGEKLDKEYKKNKTYPQIYSFTYDEQLGPRVQITNPDPKGLPQTAKLKGFDPIGVVSLMYAFGYPEAVPGYITESLQPGDKVPILSYEENQPSDNPFVYKWKGEKGKVQNFLYNKTLGRNVTVGDMMTVKEFYPDNNINIPEDSDPDSPYIFKHKFDVAIAADALYDILNQE